MKRFLKALFVTNVRNKATALVLAAVIWLVVSFEVSDVYERDDVIVEVVPCVNGIVMEDVAVEPSPLIVKAKFVAPKRIAQQYLGSAAKVRALHKLENPRIGTPIRIELNREDFDLPYDIKLDQVKPRRPAVVLRRIITRKLRVKVELRGLPAQGYELSGEPQVEPTEVTVRGPKETLEVVDSIHTVPVNIEGRSNSFSSDYSLADKLDEKPVQTTTEVRVRIGIRPTEIIKSFSVPLRVNTPPGYRHEALLPGAGEKGTVEIAIKGPEYLLNESGTAKKISAFVVVTIDMKPRREIPYSAKIHLFVPPELGELKLAGEQYVDLEIREKEERKPEKKEGS